ncbi:hypothetical protein L218DRAFT_961383 [Marasmius fiardii PR-910]|nr:hypothetical protein L218DRAFT_961383 [Marasmius fiardii PR-910]
MRSTALKVSTFVAVAGAFQIQSNNPAFQGRQGCISASSNADGASVVIHDCATEDNSNHDWDFSRFTRVNSGPQPLKVFGNKCLDVKDGRNADGTKLQIWSCADGNTNQQWISVTDLTFQWAGTNKCIDLTDGKADDGNQLQIWTCDSNNSNQKWTANASSGSGGVQPPAGGSSGNQLLASGGPQHLTSQCLTASSNSDGAKVALAPCVQSSDTFPNGNYTWVLPAAGSTGQIKTFDGTKCLDVRDGQAGSNGNLLQIWSCVEGNTNQLWNVEDICEGPQAAYAQVISWAGQGDDKCIDVKDGGFAAGNDLQIWDCDPDNGNQWWTVSRFEL